MQQDESEQSVPKLKKFRQRKREVQCAVNLAQKVQPFIDLNENEEVGIVCRTVIEPSLVIFAWWRAKLRGDSPR
jgi:hypothetical protein